MAYQRLDQVRINIEGKTWQCDHAYEALGQLHVIFMPVNENAPGHLTVVKEKGPEQQPPPET